MAEHLVQIKKRPAMKTAGPYTITDADWADIRDMFYNNVHDWISRRFISNMPNIITGFWVSLGVLIWIMSSIILPWVLN